MAQDSKNPICPYCFHEHDDPREGPDVVSYWGEDYRFDCFKCGKEFELIETVVRTYESKKVETNEH